MIRNRRWNMNCKEKPASRRLMLKFATGILALCLAVAMGLSGCRKKTIQKSTGKTGECIQKTVEEYLEQARKENKGLKEAKKCKVYFLYATGRGNAFRKYTVRDPIPENAFKSDLEWKWGPVGDRGQGYIMRKLEYRAIVAGDCEKCKISQQKKRKRRFKNLASGEVTERNDDKFSDDSPNPNSVNCDEPNIIKWLDNPLSMIEYKRETEITLYYRGTVTGSESRKSVLVTIEFEVDTGNAPSNFKVRNASDNLIVTSD